MTGFLSKLFGKGKKGDVPVEVVKDTLEGLIEKGGFKLYYDVKTVTDEQIEVELHGDDDGVLKDRDGQLLDSFQFLVKRVIQHKFPESKTDIVFDSNGYREESNQELIKVAEKLKAIVIEKGKSVYVRALPPKDRKVIHQHLANDERVKSRSVGEGLYKKIKIFPASQANTNQGAPRRGGKRDDENTDASSDNAEAAVTEEN